MEQQKRPVIGKPALIAWGLGYILCLICTAGLIYFWRVFFEYSVNAFWGTLIACGVTSAIYFAAFFLSNFIKDFNIKTAIIIFLVGLLFVFVTPPLQVPDEITHYRRAYAIGTGHFDFDASREYPSDVTALCHRFGIALVAYHNGNPITETESAATRLEDYKADVQKGAKYEGYNEPVMFMIVPFIPQAIGMALARLFGLGGALEQMYAGRLGNLIFYAIMCFFAIKNCKRYKPILLSFALLPLSLFVGASNSYDGMVLGLTFFVLSYYCKDELDNKSMLWFVAAFSVMCAIKANNLLLIAVPFLLPKAAWKLKFKKWQVIIFTLGITFVAMAIFDLYGNYMQSNYGPPQRMLEGVNVAEQVAFVLQYIPRFCAVALGTLYQEALFIFGLGVFGLRDLPLPLVSGGSVMILMLASALSVHKRSSLNKKSAIGLLVLSLLYIGGVLAAMYITFTPVGMITILGLQPRYFLAAFVMLAILLAAVLSRTMIISDTFEHRSCPFMLTASGCFALLSVLNIFQSYFVGPIMGS